MDGNIIEVTNLQKSYGNLRAVDGISFYVEEGSLFAFLGPNGAGKSTTIDMLSTQLAPSGGKVVIGGHLLGRDDDAIRRDVGIVFQESLLDPLLTVKENLMVRGGFYGLPRRLLRDAVNTAIAAVAGEEFLTRPYGKLSGGQRRRADIARALLSAPRILFLDEPTTGLDPQTRKKVWETIRSLQEKNGMTIFLTTHYMEEAAQADYITIIDHGKLCAKGTPAALKERYTQDTLPMSAHDPAQMERSLCAAGIVFKRAGGEYIVRLAHTADAIPLIALNKDNILGMEIRRGSMDDVFLNITGAEVRN